MRAGESPRLRVRIALAVLLGALVVGAGVALLLHNTLQLRRTANLTIRVDTYQVRAAAVEDMAINVETGLRGDVITGRRLFLQPLHRAEAKLPAATGALERSALATGLYRRQVGQLVAALHAYIAHYVPGVLALVAQNPAAARSYAVTLEGKREVDAIRRRWGNLQRLLSNRSSQRQRQSQQTANLSVGESIAVLVLLTLLTVSLGGYLGHLAVERERARRRSDETTQTLQESILPPALPEIPGCELAVRFIPGDGPVSGDFYDAFGVAADRWALVMGDVCGKGSAAAAATAMARWTLRSSLGQGASPADALRLLNATMLGHEHEQRLITAMCMTVALEQDRARVEIACAGHPPPILVPALGAPASVSARGDLLGAYPDLRLDTVEVELHPGESIAAFTDGVTDQGPETRMPPEHALHGHAGASAEALASRLERLARRPVGSHPDDIAVMTLRFLGQEPVAGTVRAGTITGH